MFFLFSIHLVSVRVFPLPFNLIIIICNPDLKIGISLLLRAWNDVDIPLAPTSCQLRVSSHTLWRVYVPWEGWVAGTWKFTSLGERESTQVTFRGAEGLRKLKLPFWEEPHNGVKLWLLWIRHCQTRELSTGAQCLWVKLEFVGNLWN